jgi:hypothetical protein
MTKTTKKKPTWNDLKHNLADLDRNALLGLVQDLYVASKDNQAFLHVRFGLRLGFRLIPPFRKCSAS